jgi:uncharacterized repeat protein (TIGR01451 family)
VTAGQNPHLAIVKTFSPASYSAVGQTISYTITVTNDGNVTLHNVTVTDPNASNLSCTPAIPVADLAPGAGISCTANHVTTQADLDAGHYANQACVDDGAGPAAQQCSSVDTPGNPPLKGHIMHTGVTCSDFVSDNPSNELTDATYNIKSNKVNNVAPGVMFYYITIKAPSPAFTINVRQTNNASWKPIPVSGLNQIILYEANCSKSSKGTASYNTADGTASIQVSGATTNATYIVGIKYSLSGLSGQPQTPPGPVVTYSFDSIFTGNVNPIASSQDSIKVSPKP